MEGQKEADALERFSRRLDSLDKDMELLFDPRHLPTSDTAKGKYPALTRPVQKGGAHAPHPQTHPVKPHDPLEEESMRSSSYVARSRSLSKPASTSPKAQHDDERALARESKPGARKEEKHLQKFPSGGLILPRSPTIRENIFPKDSMAHSQTWDGQKEEEHPEDRGRRERFLGVARRVVDEDEVHPKQSVEAVVSAAGMAAVAAATEAASSEPLRYRVTIKDDTGSSSFSESADTEVRETSKGETEHEYGGSECPSFRKGAGKDFEPVKHSPRPQYRVNEEKDVECHFNMPKFSYSEMPPPKSLTEMQRMMEDEWLERERRLRLQHQRQTERIVAQEVEKITHEYGRRLIFELQQQEQLMEEQQQQQRQQQQQQLQDLLDDKWKQQQQIKDLQQKLAMVEHRKNAVEAEAQVLQQETETGSTKLQQLKTENAYLSSSVAGLERQLCESKSREEDARRQLQICQTQQQNLQQQLQHEGELCRGYAQRRRALEQQVDELEQAKAQAELYAQQLTTDMSRLRTHNDAIAAQNAQLQNQVETLVREAKRLELRIRDQTSNEEERMEHVRKIEDLTDELHQKEKKNSDIIASLRMRIQHLEKIEWNYTTLRSEFENVRLEVQRLRDENATLLAEAKQRGQHEQNSRGENRALLNELLAAQQENFALKKDLYKLTKGNGTAPLTFNRDMSREALGNKTSPDNPLNGDHLALTPTDPGKASCIVDCSIVPSRQRVSSVRGPLYGSDSKYDEPRSLMMGKTNNPRERSTQPPPALPASGSPLEHRHMTSVLAKRAGAKLMAGMDSLEKQLTLLGAEKRRVEGELIKMPASSGRNAKERERKSTLESRLADIDKTIHRIKMTLYQTKRRSVYH